MIDELFIYGRKESVFKDICAQIADISTYHVSPNYGHDLNTSNLQLFIKDKKYGLQDVAQKYPICVCITPRSAPVMINGYRWEQFYFSLFFLERTGYANENEVRDIDVDTQLSQDEEPDNWSRMKLDAMQFLDLLSETLKGNVSTEDGTMPFRSIVNFDYTKVNIRRLSNFNNDKISGVELSFTLFLSIASCEIDVINGSYYVPKFQPDYYEKILDSGTDVVVDHLEHKLKFVKGITLLNPSYEEVEVNDSINGLTVTVHSNIDLNNHTLIIF